MVYTPNWVIIYHLPIKGTRKLHWTGNMFLMTWLHCILGCFRRSERKHDLHLGFHHFISWVIYFWSIYILPSRELTYPLKRQQDVQSNISTQQVFRKIQSVKVLKQKKSQSHIPVEILAGESLECKWFSSWWFQPLWNILVKMGSSSPNKGEHKQYLKPPASFSHVANSVPWIFCLEVI